MKDSKVTHNHPSLVVYNKLTPDSASQTEAEVPFLEKINLKKIIGGGKVAKNTC